MGEARAELRELRRLARLHGVHATWRDNDGVDNDVSPETLLAVLRALQAPLERVGEAPEAARAVVAERRARVLEPVVVVEEGERARVCLRLPEREAEGACSASLHEWDHESGAGAERGRWRVELGELPVRSARDGQVVREWTLPEHLGLGYFELVLELPAGAAISRLVVAPRRAPPLGRGVGLFAPLFSLHSAATRGAGGFAELGRLAQWAGEAGADAVATLPITACEAGEASPYAPLSRRFWNERFVYLGGLPELARSQEARRLAAELEAPGSERLVDVVAAARGVGRVLALCSRALSESRAEELEAFARERPEARAFARWRAEHEARGAPWWEWPAGEPLAGEAAVRAELYAQWVCEAQLGEVAERARAARTRLFLDLPIGVREDGFDVFSAPEAFVTGSSAGAPPDAFFAGGQDWGFPPPHPEGARRRVHRDLALAVRRHARFAGVLRLDHAMALHRLWVVPRGSSPRAGAYLAFPAREMYAVLVLEAARGGCAVVGEDLGTVPWRVREVMGAHGIARTVVLPFAFEPHDPGSIDRLPGHSVVALGTHDLPPFASFWSGRDLDEQEERGELGAEALAAEREGRARFREAWLRVLRERGLLGEDEHAIPQVLRASFRLLARARPDHLQVDLADLLGEEQRINAPGTQREENWRGLARLPLEELERHPAAAELLRELGRERVGSRAPL